jgi:hypothetical protein
MRTHATSAFVMFVMMGLGVATHGCMESPSAPNDRRAKESRAATAPSNGFNDAIVWRGLDEGLAEAAKEHRPLMLVVHAAWCRSCKALKPSFGDASLVDLSHDFVMVNLDQDAEPRSLQFAPDGDYIPRVVFVDPKTAAPDLSIHNPRRANKRYYYGPGDDIVGAMKKALARHGET